MKSVAAEMKVGVSTAGDTRIPRTLGFRSHRGSMRQKPDYAKAAAEASAAITQMKIKRGTLHGYHLGSGNRAEAIARFRRRVEIAAEHLSTEGIDFACLKIIVLLGRS